MEVKIKDFIQKGQIVSLVHFNGTLHHLKNNSNIFYILNNGYRQNMNVQKYFEKNFENFSLSKFRDACKMVLLSETVLENNLKNLSKTEAKKLKFVEALLQHSETLVFFHFEDGFYGKDRLYYQKLFLKLTKYGKSILCITDDVSFLFGMVSKFVLFEHQKYRWIDDFYDDEIYQNIEMPEIISYIKYLNRKKIPMDHYIEIKEILKAIYRSVNSRNVV